MLYGFQGNQIGVQRSLARYLERNDSEMLGCVSTTAHLEIVVLESVAPQMTDLMENPASNFR